MLKYYSSIYPFSSMYLYAKSYKTYVVTLDRGVHALPGQWLIANFWLGHKAEVGGDSVRHE